MKGDEVFRLRSDVRHRTVADEAVVLRQQEGEVLVLNEVGAELLELVDGRRPVAGILDALHERFDVARDELEADVASFLHELEQSHVVERVES